MSEEKKAEPEADAPPPKKRPAIIGKILANKSYILHCLFVFLLFAFFVWQILDFYLLSTDYNRGRAVKTNHMAIFDIETGQKLANLPSEPDKAEEAEDDHAEEEHPAPPVEVPQPEVAVIITGVGKDADYTSQVTKLPPEFVFSYSPYGSKPLETSKYKAAEGAAVIAEVIFADGKFDISTKNTDFRNNKNVEAAVSKIFGANAVYAAVPESFMASPSFGNLATSLEDKQLLLVVPGVYKGANKNVIGADIVIKGVTPLADIKLALAKLEEAAKLDGYAIAVIEPQPEAAAALTEWLTTLEAKKIKLTPVIKN